MLCDCWTVELVDFGFMQSFSIVKGGLYWTGYIGPACMWTKKEGLGIFGFNYMMGTVFTESFTLFLE